MIKPDVMAEKTVLNCLFLCPELINDAVNKLVADDFKYTPNKIIFEICEELFLSGVPIDIVKVNEKFKNEAYLADVLNTTPTTANFKYYVETVKNNAKKVNASMQTQELLSLLASEDIQLCQEKAAKILETLNADKKHIAVSPREAMAKFFASKGKKREYIKTGIEDLDKQTYIDRGDYVIVGGRPSSGKTALTLQIMLNMAKQYKVVYFSLETTADKIYDRLVACFTQTPLPEIKKGGHKEEGGIRDWDKIVKKLPEFVSLDFTVVESNGWTVPQIKAEVEIQKADIILIDYLSLIQAQGKSTLDKVTNISLALRGLAMQSNVAVIALSQLNREGRNEPDMTNLRESGQIEQDADVVILLREDKDTTKRDLLVVKNKEGTKGKIRLHFEGVYQKFYAEAIR